MTVVEAIADVVLHKFCGFDVQATVKATTGMVTYECPETGMKMAVDGDTALTIYMATKDPAVVEEETIAGYCWLPVK